MLRRVSARPTGDVDLWRRALCRRYRSLWLDSKGRYPPYDEPNDVDTLRFLTKKVLPNGAKIKAALAGLAVGGGVFASSWRSRL